MANSLDYSNIGLTSFVEARDPTASETNAQLDQTFCNSATGDHFVCIEDTPAAQQWQRTSDGMIFPNPILATNHPNLVAMYTMDNISGSTLNDESPNARNMTINGAVAVSGRTGNALSFNGSSDYCVGADTDFPEISTGEFAFCMWVKPDNAPSGSAVGFMSYKQRTAMMHDGPGADRGTIQAFDTDWRRATPNQDITDTTNYSLVIGQRSGNTLEYYINNALIGTVAIGTISSTLLRDVFIGCIAGGTDNRSAYFAGDIDTVRFFNRSLTADERTSIYNEV